MLQNFVGSFDLFGFLAWLQADSAHGVPLYLSNLFGWAEVALSIAAAFATRMIPLRYASMFSNAAGLAYGLVSGYVPSIVEHGVNLPLNAARARQMQKLIVAVRKAAETDLNIEWLKPFAHARQFKAGETIFRKGDNASEAFIVTEGEVEIPEAGAQLRPGDIFGEMALFTQDGARLASAVCKTDVELLYITYEEFEQHYFQNPEFGLYLVRLIVRRLERNHRRALSALEAS
jgi:CRP/FNR family transcriptional regulator, cyclic AMP receptor protein